MSCEFQKRNHFIYLFDKLERDWAVQIRTLDLMLTKTSNQWKSFATKSVAWLRNHLIWSIEQNDKQKANIFCLSALITSTLDEHQINSSDGSSE